MVGLYPSEGEEQFFTDLDHPNWTYTVVVNGVENLRPVIEGSSMTISGWELSYRPTDVVSVHVTLQGDAPMVDPPLTNFTVVKIQSTDGYDVVPGSLVTVGGQTAATHPPVTDFTGTPLSGTVPLFVSFWDISTNYPSSWNWSFGDGTWFNYSGLVPMSPIHTYNVTGTYTVSLTTANAMGSTTATKTGYVMVTNRTTQIGVFRNSTGTWYLDDNKTGAVYRVYIYGKPGDVPIVGDWNSDSVSDTGIFRPSNGNWYLDTAKAGVVYAAFHFGKPGDIPVVGDWNGDGTSDAGVFRPSNGNWYQETTRTGVVNTAFHFGKPGDIPVVGDWNGDGTSDAGVFRPSNGNWYQETTRTGVVNTTFHFGKPGDIPVVGDWDGDGFNDIGVFRPSSGNWYLDYNKTGVVDKTFHFGKSGDIPVVGNWDEDGFTDIGVFRPSNGNWYLDYNKTGVVDKVFHFGKEGDSPIAGSASPQSPPPQPSITITFNRNLTITPNTTVYIPAGGKVIWKNDDPLKPHGLAAVDDLGVPYFGGLTGVQIPYTKTYEVPFDTVGSFDYKTMFEPETTGRIIVGLPPIIK